MEDANENDQGEHLVKCGQSTSTSVGDPDTCSFPTIDEYSLRETIGYGSFGKVKLGVHTKSGIKVAIKMVDRQSLTQHNDRSRVQQMDREIRLLARIKHAHVIRLIKTIKSPTCIFLIVEHASGGDLFSYIIRSGRISSDEARRFMQQIISALHHCHSAGIVHRDLKPENVLLDSWKNVKIADFGLAGVLSDGKLLRTACGSPNYASPEIIQHTLYAGPEVDIWSAGVILYIMLVGTLPFTANNLPHLFAKILDGFFEIPPFVDQDAAALLCGMICVDTIMRFTISEIRRNAWFAFGCPKYLFPNMAPETDYSEVDLNLVHNLAVKTRLDVDVHDSMQASTSSEHSTCPSDESSTCLPSCSPVRMKRSHNNRRQACSPQVVQSNFSRHSSASNMVKCTRVCLPEGATFCKQDCELCPRWGANRCLFAHRVQKLAQCDLCMNYKGRGCIYSMETLTLEDLLLPNPNFEIGSGERLQFSVGAVDRMSPPTRGGNESDIEDRLRVNLLRRKCKHENWHLGIQSTNEPRLIITSFCKMLKRLDLVWRRCGPYELVVTNRDQTLMLNVQLYRVKTNTYLLDFFHVLDQNDQDINNKKDSFSGGQFATRMQPVKPGPRQEPEKEKQEKIEKLETESEDEGNVTPTDVSPYGYIDINDSESDCDLPASSSTLRYLDQCAVIIRKITTGK